jgi:hypothetical protein
MVAMVSIRTSTFELQRNQVLQELREWVQSSGDADEPFIGLANGVQTLSPRQILSEVENRSPLGDDFVRHWGELAKASVELDKSHS